MRIVCQHTLFCQKLGEMLQNLSSAAVVIGIGKIFMQTLPL